MIHNNNGRTGFSLFEIIIALGLISVVGILIAQMFMASVRLHAHVRDVDTASFIAMSTLEELSSASDPNMLLNTEFIEGAQVAFGHSAFFVIDERMAFSAFDFSSGFRLYKYYDVNWEPVRLEAAEVEPHSPQNADAAFKLALYLTPSEQAITLRTDIVQIEGLFEVTLYMWKISHTGAPDEPFVSFYTQVYFPIAGNFI